MRRRIVAALLASLQAGCIVATETAQGPQGDAGPQGPQGDMGPQGPQGDAGPQGKIGDPGDPGTPGAACWDLNSDAINDPAEDANGDGSWNALDCAGVQGDTGPQGLKGDPGDMGAPGAKGDPGDMFWLPGPNAGDIYYSSGNVGIGTSAPSAIFQVVPKGASETQSKPIYLWAGEGNELGNSYSVPALVDLRAYSMNENIGIPIDQAMVSRIVLAQEDRPGNNSAGHISFYTNPSNFNTLLQERMTIASDGRVGIGTATPGNDLHVFSNDGSTGVLVENSAPNSHAQVTLKNDVGEFFVRMDGATSDNLLVGSDFGGEVVRMCVTPSGNVGIGTTTPTATLDVEAGPSVNGSIISAHTSNDGGTGLYLGYDDGSNALFLSAEYNPGSTSSRFDIRDQGVNVMTFTKGTGNIGIGTTNPVATLDVNGTARLAKYASPPVNCDAAHDGTIALTSTYAICVCKGNSSQWVSTATPAAPCPWM